MYGEAHERVRNLRAAIAAANGERGESFGPIDWHRNMESQVAKKKKSITLLLTVIADYQAERDEITKNMASANDKLEAEQALLVSLEKQMDQAKSRVDNMSKNKNTPATVDETSGQQCFKLWLEEAYPQLAAEQARGHWQMDISDELANDFSQ